LIINRIRCEVFKLCLLIFLIMTTALAVFIHENGADFDLVAEIHRLQSQNRRDDAIDLVSTFRDSTNVDQEELEELEKNLEYSAVEKVKSVVWNGVVKCEVNDKLSGVGSVISDSIVLGDIRDISIQSWHYLTDKEKYDSMIMILAGAGVGLSSAPFFNGCASLAKNSIKYLKRIPTLANKGLLKKLLSGKMSPGDSEKVYSLLRRNDNSIPRTVSSLANVNNVKELDIASDIINRYKRTGNAFLNLNGAKGLELYAALPTDLLKRRFIKAFKSNPRAVMGLTNSHIVIHSIKILKKYRLQALLVPVSMFAMFLAMLPPTIVWGAFITTSAYFIIKSIWIPIKTFRKGKEKT
jgi:hypothetical protein